jgi:hypothetical protein
MRRNVVSESGLTVVEVTVAIALLTVISVAAAHLMVWAVRALWSTGAATTALAAAQDKMEELQMLAWRFDESGNRLSDFETDLTMDPPAAGGRGLAPSPTNALLENVDGYVDYLDEHGRWVGRGSRAPASAAFVRRWAIRPLAAAPEDALVLQVLVVPLATVGAGSSSVSSGHRAGESLLTTARSRVR